METPDDLLPLFSPMEMAVIITLKQMAKNEASGDVVQNLPVADEHHNLGGTHD